MTGTKSARTIRSLGNRLSLIGSVGLTLLGMYLLLGGGIRPESAVSSARAAGNQQRSLSAAPALPTRPIEAIRVGDRVEAGNPEGAAPESEVDPRTWRKLTLTMHSHGVDVDITLLRAVDWIRAKRAAVGASIELNLPEMDMVGPAHVLAIEPCPALKPGTGRVVTGTFAHDDGAVLDLRLEGLDEPIGVTANHSIYSKQRRAFVKARDLKAGELLHPVKEATRVVSITPRLGAHRVYNLEVSIEHAYRVTSLGILVHNSCYEDIGDLRITNKVGAGAARPPRHHLFPQQYGQWFADRGVNINKATIALDQGTHSALHTMNWNQRLMTKLFDAEKQAGRALSAREIWQIGYRQAREFNLRDLTFIPFAD